jgi:hypothetical protein
MSNVLIGIIGVILFIGLALAGALILGDDFKSANSESRAAAAIAMVQQASSAIAMHNLKLGTPYSQGPLNGLVPRFLKAVPTNPIDGSASYQVDTRDANGYQVGPAVMTAMGFPMNARNKDVCLAAARGSNMPMINDMTVPVYAGIPTHPAGCYVSASPFGGIGTDMYIIYSRV